MGDNDIMTLADKIEDLTGPCRVTDNEIQEAMGWFPRGDLSPKYTASVDAALTIAPDYDLPGVLADAMAALAKSYWLGGLREAPYYREALPRYICAAALRSRKE